MALIRLALEVPAYLFNKAAVAVTLTRMIRMPETDLGQDWSWPS